MTWAVPHPLVRRETGERARGMTHEHTQFIHELGHERGDLTADLVMSIRDSLSCGCLDELRDDEADTDCDHGTHKKRDHE